MMTQKEMLEIICSEAVEYGGLQEVPGQKHGARHSYFAAKRGARTAAQETTRATTEPITVPYDLRLVREGDGKLRWED